MIYVPNASLSEFARLPNEYEELAQNVFPDLLPDVRTASQIFKHLVKVSGRSILQMIYVPNASLSEFARLPNEYEELAQNVFPDLLPDVRTASQIRKYI